MLAEYGTVLTPPGVVVLLDNDPYQTYCILSIMQGLVPKLGCLLVEHLGLSECFQWSTRPKLVKHVKTLLDILQYMKRLYIIIM